MGNTTNTTSINNINSIKSIIKETMNDTYMENIFNQNIKSSSICSAEISNNVTFLDNNGVVGNINITNNKVDQIINFNMDCVQNMNFISDLSLKLSNSLYDNVKNDTTTDQDNKTKSTLIKEFGSGIADSTNTKSESNTNNEENLRQTVVNRVSNIIKKNINVDTLNMCSNKSKNDLTLIRNTNKTGDINISGMQINQTISSLSKCLFTNDIKEKIANDIINDAKSVTDNKSTSKQKSEQENKQEQKGAASIIGEFSKYLPWNSTTGSIVLIVALIIGGIILYLYLKNSDGEEFQNMKMSKRRK